MLFVIREIDNEPHGILQIASVLEDRGHEVRLVVASRQDPVEVAADWAPQVVGYSVYTGTQRWYMETNRRIKSMGGALSVFGGPHPTFFPEIIEEDGVDVVCVGEGEYATLDLLDALELGRPITRIPNLWVKADGRVHRNSLRPLIDDLDTLPPVGRDVLYEAYPLSRDTQIKPFFAGRGCPYNCSFCFNFAYSQLYENAGRRVRRRSVGNLIDEIQAVRARSSLQFITFMDDTFSLFRGWLEEFADRYSREVGLPFWCQVRADLVTSDLVDTLKRAGCFSVSLGLETANDHLRNQILKRNMSKEQIIRASELLQENGIHVMTNNMLGLPTGSLETDWETLELNVRCRPGYANVFLFQPYPKTELGEMAMREGFMEGTFDDLTGSVTDTTIIRFGSEEEKHRIENLQKLFALGVEFPFLLPLIRWLIGLPFRRAYWLVYKLWKGYALKRRFYPHQLSLMGYVRALGQFMSIKTQ